MKLMMIMGAGGCFIVAFALGYVQENTLPTTLLRAVIAMLIGLFLARWWGLILQRQLPPPPSKNEFIKRRANSVRRGGSIGNT